MKQNAKSYSNHVRVALNWCRNLIGSPLFVAILLTVVCFYGYYRLAVSESCLLYKFLCRSPIDDFWNLPINQMGDTLSGLASAIILIWVIASTFIQGKELRDQREEFSKTNDVLAAQRFDSAFFAMIATYTDILADMSTATTSKSEKDERTSQNDKRIYKKGRDCFGTFTIRLTSIYRSKSIGQTNSTRSVLKESYEIFWDKNRDDLGHYFRFLYNFFRFVDESEFDSVSHGRLLRSQLSDKELLILFYNCLSDVGGDFQRYARKYALFDNLPGNQLLSQDHANLMHKDAWGKNDYAQYGHTNP